MNEVIDLVQRKRALDPAESFIVQAPAGSGKTELLIQRYLRVLSMVDDPEEVIAITFTRKAAAEMRGRILSALDHVVSSDMIDDAAAGITHGLAAKVIEQDKKRVWQLSENPGRLRIQTIDSLTASLTRQMPILSKFGAQPETLENASELYHLAAANTLAELESNEVWSASIEVLVRHLDNDLPRVRNMLANMLSHRDQWLRHIGIKHQRGVLEAALTHLVESVLERAEATFPLCYQSELLEILRFAAGNLHEDGSASIIATCVKIEALPASGASNLDKWRAITSLLFTLGDKWRKSANVKLGFPAASGNKLESETRKAMKIRFAALIANLSKEEGLAKILCEIKYLPDTRYSDAEWQVVEALYQLLVLADAQLRLLFSERMQMDFGGITQAAILALGTMESPTDLALQLDYKIKHILVDEFQDISINQFILLEKLTAGWSEGDQHSLFLVGDPMQSIYRFREAEVGLFLNTWEQKRINQVALTPLNITVNFRSEPGIVDWINEAFKKVLPESPDVKRGAVNYVSADAFNLKNVENPVQVHPILSRNDGHEADLLLKLLKDLKKSDPEGSIAILVRNRSHLKEIVIRLREAGFPYRAVEIEAMGKRAAIQDLLALTLALTHFSDRVAWLALLRAPWCGLSLADLHELVGNNKSISIWECMQSQDRVQAMSDDGQQRLQRMNTILIEAFGQRRRRRLNRWVESVWMNIGGPASLQNESDLENSQSFFQLLSDFDEGGDLKQRETFAEQVALLYAEPDIGSDAGVQIMTIHKAKGLEFDTVFLPGLSRGSGVDESRLLLWMETPHAGHQDLLLAPVKEAGKSNSPVYNYMQRLENEKQVYELGRLLYVATTRAKKRLHLFATAEVSKDEDSIRVLPPRRNSLLAQLWPVVKDSFDDALNSHKRNVSLDKNSTDLQPPLLRRFPPDWVLPSPPPLAPWKGEELDDGDESKRSVIEYEWAGETIKHIGSVVHRCIQWIAEHGSEYSEEEIIAGINDFQQSQLQRLGVVEKELLWANSQIRQAISNLLRDDRGKWLFSEAHSQVRNEYALSGLYQGKVVNVFLDRTFVDSENRRWIVDYKTSRHEGSDIDVFLDQQKERYQEQLEKYGMLMREMENRPISLGLYFPLLQGWRAWELP